MADTSFKARARAVDMLGRQQIAGVPNAISELFKNAHDAYADRVEVDYFMSDGLFVLRDDGIGMKETEFVERWLTLGTESKLGVGFLEPPPKDPTKPKRVISGEKGIGRLAIAAIGPQVLVLTRAGLGQKRHDLVAAFIHWGLFELPGVNLDEIKIPVRTFKGGTLPSHNDLTEMIKTVQESVSRLEGRVDSNNIKQILNELDRFTVDIIKTARFLAEVSPDLTLERNGRGTHFYILPATDTIAEDIAFDAEEKDEISKLRRQLLGFTDTMTPTSPPPVIHTAFRYWQTDDQNTDLLEAKEFFTPEDFADADHHFKGTFDEFGRFKGTVKVFDHPPEKFVLPWQGATGQETACGPFSIDIAYVQGQQRKSKLPPERWTLLTNKLDRIGGLYIYRDGIRILPYGDADFDFLEIEKRRTKGMAYYYFSYRRFFGAIYVSREINDELQEKAGREGFIENKAYREFRRILMNFLIQVVAEFFREGGERYNLFDLRRFEIEQREKARKEAEELGRKERRTFERKLDQAFSRINNREPQQKTQSIVGGTIQQLGDAIKHGQMDLFGNNLIDIETEALHRLNSLRSLLQIERPEGVALTQDLSRDWMIYASEVEEIEREIFSPAEKQIRQIVSETAERIKIELNQRERVKSEIEPIVKRHLTEIQELKTSTQQETRILFEHVMSQTSQSLEEVDLIAGRIEKEINELELSSLTPKELDRYRSSWEREISDVAEKNRQVLEHIRVQIKEVNWIRDEQGYLIGSAEMRAALEEELLALRDQVDTSLQLSQLGMAIEIINHEFNNTIRAIRSAIGDLQDWVNTNPKLQPVYRNIRDNFEHLDGYLKLFTPLQRRLRRQAIDIEGASIATFLQDLFHDRLDRKNVDLVVSPAFREKTVIGYPSTFYPVFVNLIDNAIFWLENRPEPREIHLDADGEGFIVWDTGPGIPLRDREVIFEMGFTLKPGGRGLGLYISREVLKREGYRLELERSIKKRGATFRIIPDN